MTTKNFIKINIENVKNLRLQIQSKKKKEQEHLKLSMSPRKYYGLQRGQPQQSVNVAGNATRYVTLTQSHNRRTDKHTDRQTDRETDRPSRRHIKQTDGDLDRQLLVLLTERTFNLCCSRAVLTCTKPRGQRVPVKCSATSANKIQELETKLLEAMQAKKEAEQATTATEKELEEEKARHNRTKEEALAALKQQEELHEQQLQQLEKKLLEAMQAKKEAEQATTATEKGLEEEQARHNQNKEKALAALKQLDELYEQQLQQLENDRAAADREMRMEMEELKAKVDLAGAFMASCFSFKLSDSTSTTESDTEGTFERGSFDHSACSCINCCQGNRLRGRSSSAQHVASSAIWTNHNVTKCAAARGNPMAIRKDVNSGSNRENVANAANCCSNEAIVTAPNCPKLKLSGPKAPFVRATFWSLLKIAPPHSGDHEAGQVHVPLAPSTTYA